MTTAVVDRSEKRIRWLEELFAPASYVSFALERRASDESHVCRSCGAKVPRDEGFTWRYPFMYLCGPCLLQYNVDPGDLEERLAGLEARGLKLHDFQLKDVLRASKYRALLLAEQMGTGKTVIACMGALRNNMPNLIVVPSSLKRNWAREIEKWRPELDVSIVARKPDFRFPTEPGQALITSYGMLPGAPCPGCRWRGWGSSCTHVEENHPEWLDDRGKIKIPYHPKGGKAKIQQLLEANKGDWREIPHCGGCKQASPLPKRLKVPIVLLGDEVHAFKHPDSERTKLWRRATVLVWKSEGYVFGLSGTQYENRPQEGWEVARSLGLERIAFPSHKDYKFLFRDWYDYPAGERRPPRGRDRDEILLRLRRIRIVRRSKDVLKDLPPIREQEIEVPLSKASQHAVDEAAHRLFATKKAWEEVRSGRYRNPHEKGLLPDEEERRKRVLQERIDDLFERRPWAVDEEMDRALKDVLYPANKRPSIIGDPNDPEALALSAVRKQLALAKLPAVLDWVATCEEEEEPVVLFCQHVSVVKKVGERPGWGAFYGGLSEKARDDLVQGFQGGSIKAGLSVSIGAGSEGLTLTRARICAFADENYNPAKNKQAWHRVWRIGAEQHTKREGVDKLCVEDGSILIVRFVAQHPVDQAVRTILREKGELLDALDDPEVE